MKTYGYARVSTREQNEARQMDALNAFGVDQIYLDKQSGKDFNRPQYQRLLRKLQADDILVIKSIDRLGRNYDEILEQWRLITKEKKAAIVVLDMPLLDTRKGRDLTGTLIADIVLQLLSYVAETERAFIKQRQAEGIAAAKARGQKFGQPTKKTDWDEYERCVCLWRMERLSSRAAAKRLGVANVTFLRWMREDEESGVIPPPRAGERSALVKNDHVWKHCADSADSSYRFDAAAPQEAPTSQNATAQQNDNLNT